MNEHKYDPESQFCLICGQAAQKIIDKQLQCIEIPNNVYAISHIIAHKRMKEIINDLLHTDSDRNPTS